MNTLRGFCGVMLGICFAVNATAEPIRTTYTKENKFPEIGHFEVGGLLKFSELSENNIDPQLNDASQWGVIPYGRYQATENLAVSLEVPIGGLDPDMGDSEMGLGDIRMDLELLAYEYQFRYPYVIPHMSIGLDTANDDAAIGKGGNSVLVGTTFGSNMYDNQWQFNLDVAFEYVQDSDNIFSLGVSTVWDITEKFSALAEAQITDEDATDGGDEDPMRFGAGVVYSPTESLSWSVIGAGAQNAKENGMLTVRVSYDL